MTGDEILDGLRARGMPGWWIHRLEARLAALRAQAEEAERELPRCRRALAEAARVHERRRAEQQGEGHEEDKTSS